MLHRPHAGWELRRQGLQFEADIAERKWEKGQIYTPEHNTPMSKRLREVIDRVNWEIKHNNR